jgi:tetratricopeptide (TPR) repeat protein
MSSNGDQSFLPRAMAPLLVLLGVLFVMGSRPKVAEMYAELERDSGVFAMPKKEQLLVFSLGYRAALADLLFGRTMVAAGVHFSERRVFWNLDAYLKGILELDPRYRDVYRYADTLLNLSTVEMPKENLRIARDIQEQGLALFPGDAQLWMNAGLFVGYLAPQRLPESENVAEWRAAGAKMISRACDAWPPGTALPSVCVSSTRLLQKAGQTEAAIASLERLLNVSDDPQTRAQAMAKLERLMGERAARNRQRAAEWLSELRFRDLPSVSRGVYQLLIPDFDVDFCRGRSALLGDEQCASSYAQSGVQTDQL